MSKNWNHQLEDRKKLGLFRQLHPRVDSSALNLAGNDYLLHSKNPEIIEAACQAARDWGCSSTGSPLVSGYTAIHQDLEKLLSEWYGNRPVLVWNTGYAINQCVLSQVPEAGDLILADRLIHNSMIQGILKSSAKLKRYDHLNLDRLEQLLEQNREHSGQLFVVTESVFSMDGDYPDLKRIAHLKSIYDFQWILDEAHAVGWYGNNGSGLAEELGVLDQVDILIGTMGKSVGSMGAYMVLREDWERDYWINYAGEFIYSTYLSPMTVGASIRSIQMIQKNKIRMEVQTLSRKIRSLLASIGCSEIGQGDSPILPIFIGDEHRCLEIADHLKKNKIFVGAIRPPTVPKGTSRLRISLNSQLKEKDISRFVSILQEIL